MILLQLNPTIPVYTRAHGEGVAVGWLDYGPEHDLLWIVLGNASREFWVLPTKDVRGAENLTYGRPVLPRDQLFDEHERGR
jgi:hypothetical protein